MRPVTYIYCYTNNQGTLKWCEFLSIYSFKKIKEEIINKVGKVFNIKMFEKQWQYLVKNQLRTKPSASVEPFIKQA